jgi:7-carboxy-7-deazaguanine synthase
VADLVAEAVDSPVAHVVVTGGEPLLQREISMLTCALREADLHVTVETAGTVDPEFHCDLLSVSPKTSNSDPQGGWRDRHRRLRSDVGPLRRLLRRFPEHQLKFVIQDRDDVPDVIGLIQTLGTVERERVVLMPEGRSVQEVSSRMAGVAALCIEHGFRYTPRLQFDLFGGGRGV